MTAICKHYYISGRVQGVFFRRHTHKEAIALGLKGWVRNMDDGRVEVMLCGEQQQIATMQAWLWEGPSAAKVTNVEITEVPYQEFTEFEVR